MAVVWLVLRYQDDVRFLIQFFQRGYTWRGLSFCYGELRAEDLGGAGEPWIDENGERAREQAWGGGRSYGRRKGEKERSVTVEGFHSQRHAS